MPKAIQCDRADCADRYVHILEAGGWFVHACQPHALEALKGGATLMSGTRHLLPEADRLKAARTAMSKAAKESVRARLAYSESCNAYAALHEEVTGEKWTPNIIRAPEWVQDVPCPTQDRPQP